MTTETTEHSSSSADLPGSLRENAEDSERRATLSCDILKAIATLHNLEELFERVTSDLVRATSGNWAGVYLCELPTNGIELFACHGTFTNERLQTMLAGCLEASRAPFAAAVIRSHGPVTYTGADKDPFLGNQSCAELGIGRALALPISNEEQIHGVLLILDERDSSAYPAEEIDFLNLIARALAPTVELHQLRIRFDRVHAERLTLREVTSAVLEENDLRKAMELVCREAQRVTGAGGSAILLLDEEEILRVAYSIGDAADWPEQVLSEALDSVPPTIPIAPVLLDNLGDELAVPEAHIVRSLVVVPLSVHGKGFGVLQLVNLERNIPEDQLRAISLFADRVALAIEHVKLHQKHEQAAVIEERHRLARDLHDSVTQSVYGVTVFAEAAARLLEMDRVEEATEAFRELRDISLKALREMRSLIFELRPPEVAQMGLVAALEARLTAVERRAGLEAELHCEGFEGQPEQVEEGLYLIVREALNNTVKHARAANVALRLRKMEDAIHLEIEDDGVGCREEDRKSESGMGLRIMHERAESMGGTVRIESRPGEGTLVVVDVPLVSGEGE